jgi:GNAT superfamily N-acetyltransferase
MVSKTDWKDCVRWCHSDQSLGLQKATLDNLEDLARRSKYATPILTQSTSENGGTAAGYVVMHPGALGALGNLRYQASSADRSPDMETEVRLLKQVAQSLCESAFEQGAEIVQTISPLSIDPTLDHSDVRFDSLDFPREQALASVMSPIAQLVQMECFTREMPNIRPSPNEQASLLFHPFDSIDEDRWQRVVQETYEGTLDVPELNGHRSINNTLEGYAASLSTGIKPWWLLRSGDQIAGCLLLTPMGRGVTELTYLGLLPSYRGRKLSHDIMRFVEAWCMDQQVQRVTVAVDIRNLPAIRLYQSWHFHAKSFVQAWVRTASGLGPNY